MEVREMKEMKNRENMGEQKDNQIHRRKKKYSTTKYSRLPNNSGNGVKLRGNDECQEDEDEEL